MAKKDIAALAGLAALGAILSQRGKNEVTGGASRDLAPSKDTDISDLVDRFPDMGPKSYAPPEDMPRSVATSPARSSRASTGPDERYMSGSAPSRATAKAPVRVDSGAGSTPDLTSRDQLRRVEREMASRPRPLTREEMISAIPRDGYRDISGSTLPRIESESDLNRNVKNTLAALTPLGGGVGKIGAELALGRRGAQGARIAEEGRETVTNPLSWMAGPKAAREMQRAEDIARKTKRLTEADTTGGAIGYKKGGATKAKRMASGGTTRSSASSRGDGIAKKGKTRGKMY